MPGAGSCSHRCRDGATGRRSDINSAQIPISLLCFPRKTRENRGCGPGRSARCRDSVTYRPKGLARFLGEWPRRSDPIAYGARVLADPGRRLFGGMESMGVSLQRTLLAAPTTFLWTVAALAQQTPEAAAP